MPTPRRGRQHGLYVDTTRPPGDAGKVITGSILANDTDLDTPHASLNVEPVTNAATALGGSITIEADGNFTYHPDDNDVDATDTFTHRVCDNSPCNSSTVANSTGTINLVLTGQVWYVRNNQAAGGDGTSDAPFDTLAEAEAPSGTGDTVFVFDGDNTTSNLDTGYVMQTGERLVGESRPLSVDPDGSSGSLESVNLHPGTSGAQPTLTASNEDVIVLASNALPRRRERRPVGDRRGHQRRRRHGHSHGLQRQRRRRRARRHPARHRTGRHDRRQPLHRRHRDQRRHPDRHWRADQQRRHRHLR